MKFKATTDISFNRTKVGLKSVLNRYMPNFEDSFNRTKVGLK